MCAEGLFPNSMTALAAFETNSIAQGYLLADEAVKTSDVDLIEANAICAGKFLTIFKGSPAAVRSALEAAKLTANDGLLWQSLYLAKVHEDVVPAIYGPAKDPADEVLGFFESYSALAALSLGDEVAKKCAVKLIDIRLGRGLGGKSVVTFAGVQANVEEAVSYLEAEGGSSGHLSDVLLIPRPSRETYRAALPDGPGHACSRCDHKGD